MRVHGRDLEEVVSVLSSVDGLEFGKGREPGRDHGARQRTDILVLEERADVFEVGQNPPPASEKPV